MVLEDGLLLGEREGPGAAAAIVGYRGVDGACYSCCVCKPIAILWPTASSTGRLQQLRGAVWPQQA